MSADSRKIAIKGPWPTTNEMDPLQRDWIKFVRGGENCHCDAWSLSEWSVYSTARHTVFDTDLEAGAVPGGAPAPPVALGP